ncbi:unnamed protein product [Brachionus calyciflorus]|uniref:Beta-1,4-galactosyltransferase n=1 Tax=Brachionus calyciflorus TaxID=104777 RepID=A0A814D6R5_9BILA|nr:unnamed protein product [Brachionus calyciflorus]
MIKKSLLFLGNFSFSKIILAFLSLNLFIFLLYVNGIESNSLNISLKYFLFSNETIVPNSNNSKENLDNSTFPTVSKNSNLSKEYGIYNKTLCPMIPAKLHGRIPVKYFNGTFIELENSLSNLSIEKGGLWSPKECKPRYKVALIIPYRNRENILKIFLKNLHPFLQKQQIEYGIYLIEPLQNLTFNRGLLMNIGFIESLKKTNQKWECFMFHDVDLIPEDERIIYSCPEQPRHLSAFVTKFNTIVSGEALFGGVSALTKDQMKKVNGYSNLYFGWGGEDDDFRYRILQNNFKITRYPLEIGRYLMIRHTSDQKINSERFNLLKKTVERMKTDGLNSIEYKLNDMIIGKLFTKVIVSYDENYLLKKIY